MIRVAVADDQALVRSGLSTVLGLAGDIEVVGEAADGDEAVALARSEQPDVVLMDIRMPRLDGIAATRRITRETTDVRVLILTTFDLDEYVHEALRAGASGFLLKDAAPEELFAAVRVVHAGDALLAPTVTKRLIAEFTAAPPAPDASTDRRMGRLTDREREVFELVARGLSNDEIAERLVISPATAKTHVSRILTKLEARDRTQLVVLAYENGVVRPGT
jgi:DNA-binding NarL/FixJ family response regulator